MPFPAYTTSPLVIGIFHSPKRTTLPGYTNNKYKIAYVKPLYHYIYIFTALPQQTYPYLESSIGIL